MPTETLTTVNNSLPHLPEPEEAKFNKAYGYHLYMAKKPPNVVSSCIETFSKKGETVLDPFVGSGVTVGEALRLGRKVVAFDLCPLAVFITKMTVVPYSDRILENFEKTIAEILGDLQRLQNRVYQTQCGKCKSPAIGLEYSYNSQNKEEDPRERMEITEGQDAML